MAVCLAAWPLRARAADSQTPSRIVRPEGYIQFELEDGGGSQQAGAFSLSPALHTSEPASSDSDDSEPPPDLIPPPPLPPKTAREICQPIADRFTLRLAELRGNVDAGIPLDPMLQRAMFGRVALQALQPEPDATVPEATWDGELKDLRHTYLKCLKAERRR